MKNNSLRQFKIKLFIELSLKIVGSMLAFGILLVMMDGIMNDFLANSLAGFSRDLYKFVVANKSILLILLFLSVFLGTIYITLSSAFSFLDKIMKGVVQVLNKDDKLVTLPPDFKDFENQLNALKLENIRNEQAAIEAEQRKNDLVVYLAHDLKTPLTSVIGYLTLLEEEPNISDELRGKYLGIAANKSKRLEMLINEFFDITRYNLQNVHLNKERLNLTHLLYQLKDEFYPLMENKGLRCNTEIEEGLYFNADGDKLARVFDNLLRNAINYSDQNSEIRITAKQVGKVLRLEFINSGPDIPDYQLKSIFEKFYRLDAVRSSASGGAGLGLAIAKQIVELHEGTITASSSKGRTAFTLEFAVH